MKKWMQKLISQFDLEWSEGSPLSEDRATLLFLLDTYGKHLIETDSQPLRKVRENLDNFAKELLAAEDGELEKTLTRLRQYFASHRIEEYAYVQKSFDDFRGILWAFIDQMAEDFSDEKKADRELKNHLDSLREAVEANSIDSLKSQARQFIQNYNEYHNRKDTRRSKRMESIKKNLDLVKKQLTDAHHSAQTDHLTKAFNRQAFDAHIKQQKNLSEISKKPCCLLALDIDHFKKVNDTYGHAIGDFVLQECVKILQASFQLETDFVARTGGEEFMVILSEASLHEAVKRAEQVRQHIQNEAFVQDSHTIRFTISMGLAQLVPGEDVSTWIKRADQALYTSKRTGRNKLTLADLSLVKTDVA